MCRCMETFHTARGNPNMTITAPLPETGFVRLPAILRVFPISRSTWWAGVKTGKYPRSVKLSPRTTAWRVGDIRALLDAASV